MKRFLVLFFLLPQALAAQLPAQPVWQDTDYARFRAEQFFRLQAVQTPLDPLRFDRGLLEAAIFYETNLNRLQAGLPELKHMTALDRAARLHSMEMAALHYFSHTSPTKGSATVAERLAQQGIDLGYRGENLLLTYARQYEPGRPLVPPSPEAGTGFRYTTAGPDLPMHSYASLAKNMVAAWMNSPEHRKNLLDPDYRFLGDGAELYEDADYFNLEMVLATQEFSSYPGNPR